MHRRRDILSGIVSTGIVVATGAAGAARGWSAGGGIPASELGLRPGEGGDQSAAFERAAREASRRDRPLQLAPGTYVLGDVTLDDPVANIGQRGATLRCAAGARRMLHLRGREVELRNLVLEGSMQAPGRQENDNGLVTLRDVEQVYIRGCRIDGAGGHGFALEGCGGVIEKCRIRKVADAAVFSIAGSGLKVRGNNIADCGNGGVLIWQWDQLHDGAVVTGNRIRRIRADAGATGRTATG